MRDFLAVEDSAKAGEGKLTRIFSSTPPTTPTTTGIFPLILFAEVESYLLQYGGKGLPMATEFVVKVFRPSGDNTPVPENVVGKFTFAPLPGCCGVVVSTNSRLETWAQGSGRGGYGEKFQWLKQAVASKLGYSLLIATTQLRNIPEVVQASNNGWKIIHTFRNKRTDNDLGLMIKGI